MGKLDGKVCIITGCASGLGKQEAILFAEEGAAKLAICDINFEKLEETKKICEEIGAQVLAVNCDLSKLEDLENFVKKTVEVFGPHIDVLVNNAHNTTKLLPMLVKTDEDFYTEFECGPLAMFRLMKLYYPYMKGHSGFGASIINFASKAGIEGTVGHSVYASVKEGIRGLSRVAARELGADNIRVNNVMPGGFTDNCKEGLKHQSEEIQTWAEHAFSDNPFGRKGDPHDDVAPIVVFMASDDSHWMTGQTLSADGGVCITA
ncbi:SDR family oxidoreductase [Acetobacterium paludosum]|uniref:SDR family oxidoreductase n=1 Tax=Acetobacterium paludosum TaxID=52693 RepID=A0A923KS90_9FIRM|nr:SDR family oxidoreductase [Acetobacterium paludosum]MBC3888112.1 SDR family oxidoreductase [Acetobacterium paludosum]